MSRYEKLLDNINIKKAKIGVIGLGYVGLPLAVLFAQKGFTVFGFVRNKKKAKLLMEGKAPLSDVGITKKLKKIIAAKKFFARVTNGKDLKTQDVIIICVPTPVDGAKKPDLNDLKSVRDVLSNIDLTGKLIINESTVAPFTSRELFGNLHGNYFLACSPERIDPGNREKTTDSIPKVIGGRNRESMLLATALYRQILSAQIVEVDSLEVAEMTKMLENSYRAVNIALTNEFAKLADRLNIDILDVIAAAKTKWSFHPHYPGIGVGGHCIPVDPHYLISFARKHNTKLPVVREGLFENESMPLYLAKKVEKNYKHEDKILVYGISYKRDVGDIRESPVVVFCNILKRKNIQFGVYDSLIDPDVINAMGFKPMKLEKVDIFVVGTDHKRLLKDYKKAIGQNTIVIDGRNFFTKKVGKTVLGVGRHLT